MFSTTTPRSGKPEVNIRYSDPNHSTEGVLKLRMHPWETEEGPLDPRLLLMQRYSTCVVGTEGEAGSFWTIPAGIYYGAFPGELFLAEGWDREAVLHDFAEEKRLLMYEATESGIMMIGTP